MRIAVHIERLVLEGLPITTHQGAQVQRTLERELGRLLAGGGLSEELRGGTAVPNLGAGTLHLTADNHPATLGLGIARAVYGSIGKPVAQTEASASYPPRGKLGGQQ